MNDKDFRWEDLPEWTNFFTVMFEKICHQNGWPPTYTYFIEWKETKELVSCGYGFNNTVDAFDWIKANWERLLSEKVEEIVLINE